MKISKYQNIKISKYQNIKIASIAVLSILLTACGGGADDKTGNTTSGGSTTSGGNNLSLSNDTPKLPKELTSFTCEKVIFSKTEGNVETYRKEMKLGVSGNFDVELCKKFPPKIGLKNSIPNINVKGLYIESFKLCTNNKKEPISAFFQKYDSTKNKVISGWYESGKLKKTCSTDITNTLPYTLTSLDALTYDSAPIDYTSKYWICADPLIDVMAERCRDIDSVDGYNATFIDEINKKHEISFILTDDYK